MANVYFYLKENKKSEPLVVARISFNYFEINETGKKLFRTVKYSTSEKIDAKYWDSSKQRAKETNKFPQFPEFNQRLNDIETIIQNVFRKMLNDAEVITPETLKSKLDDFMIKTNKVVNPPKQTKRFTTFIKTVIDETKRGERTNEGKIFKNRTVLSYNTTYNNLLSYETHIKKNLNFSDINIKFYNKYIKYLNEKSFAPNTIGGHIKNIKVFMKLATKRGLNDNLDFSDGDFKKISEETQTIYLTETELQTIYNTDLSKNKHLIPIRDIFLIGCYTGLRFSDLKQLRKEHFYDNVIKIETEKTGKSIIIPIHPTVREIYNKYEFNLPRVISNQKMNEYIKDLGEIAKINEIIEISETRGGLKVKKNVLKYDLITVHTARRSFATNMYLADFPILAIRMITGHRTERAFLTYIKINAEENAKKMLEHPYFNQSNNLKVV